MWILGPDFQNDWRSAKTIIAPNTPNTMWYEYLSIKLYFLELRLIKASRALLLASGSESTVGAAYFLGDFYFPINFYNLNKHVGKIFVN